MLLLLQASLYPSQKSGLSRSSERHAPSNFPCAVLSFCTHNPDFQPQKELQRLIQTVKEANGGIAVRSAIGIYLDAGDEVPLADWIVDADDPVTGHVTMAVANEGGLPAVAYPDMQCEIRVASFESLPWKRHDQIFVLRAEATWRNDFLPEDHGWANIVEVLNTIMLTGDFFSVWSIHDMIHSGGTVSSRDIRRTLVRIYDALLSYQTSEELDINDDMRPLYQALADVRTLISK